MAQTFIGITIGPNIAKWNGTDPANIFQGSTSLTSMTGFFLSVPVESRQFDHLSFVQEIAWSQKGTGLDLNEVVNGIPVTGTARIVINNLEYGAFIKGYYPFGNNEVFAFAGPTMGIAIAGSMAVKSSGNGNNGQTTVKESIDLEEWGYKRFEWGIGFGTGVTIPAGKSRFSVLLRYQFGLTDVDKGEGPNAVIRNRVLNFSLGYSL
ncbi:MAG: outer membrane beta-barrel protein [Bacteroidota bacterium]